MSCLIQDPTPEFPTLYQKFQLPTADKIQRGVGGFFRKTKERLLPFFLGPQLPPKPDCKGEETLLCCEYEISVLGDMDLLLGQDDEDEGPPLLTITGCKDCKIFFFFEEFKIMTSSFRSRWLIRICRAKLKVS